MGKKFDFSGYATKNDLKCSDGRTIRKDAFKDNHGATVPLVWQHMHNEPSNILGHADLENREDGVYAFCTFNDTPAGINSKELVRHGDITSLSIYANQLQQRGQDVLHGAIREVSLVLSGANEGAKIDNVSFAHADGYVDIDDEEAIIFSNGKVFLNDLAHVEKDEEMDEEEPNPEEGDDEEDSEETVGDVLDTLTDKQRSVVYALLAEAKVSPPEEPDEEDEEEVAPEDPEEEKIEHTNKGETLMKKNVFDREPDVKKENTLSHSDMQAVISDARRFGTMKESALSHGITDIEWLFPDAKNLNTPPSLITRDMGWVQEVMSGTHHTPFSRIKSMHADITEDEARAKGYMKGNYKAEEVFTLLRRTTTPQTVYKKQKLERDDVIDITDFDVIAWLKSEMRLMLDEELARAILVGDGRLGSSNDKISEQNIRPIWKDEDLYTIKAPVKVADTAEEAVKAKAFIRAAVKARKFYKGSGNPVLFTTEDVLTDCLLLEDLNQRVIYDTVEKLATAMRVRKIITVPVMEDLQRFSPEGEALMLMGIIVNLSDYNVGADKGGAINMFEDFDIDYNAQKYLIETRCSGALIKPYSAIVLELDASVTLKIIHVNPSADLLNKTAPDFQQNIEIKDGEITGTLHYVTGFSAFGGPAADHEGHYLALQVADVPAGSTTTVEVIGGLVGHPVIVDPSDYIVLLKVLNNNIKIKFVTTSGKNVATKLFTVKNLVLTPKA